MLLLPLDVRTLGFGSLERHTYFQPGINYSCLDNMRGLDVARMARRSLGSYLDFISVSTLTLVMSEVHLSFMLDSVGIY